MSITKKHVKNQKQNENTVFSYCLKYSTKMRCCVSSCNNNSRFISKSSGITFHVFPTEPTLRKAWLVALGKDNWSPRESRAVCSAHFAPEDMYETPGGLRKLRPGAIPVLQLVCRICLDTESRLVNMIHYKLDEAFQHLTGIMVYGDSLPQQLCVECAHRLLNCDTFRRKSLRAHELMLDIINKETALTIDSLKSIDRITNSLATPLQIKHFEVDKYDYEVGFVQKTEELKHENNLEIFLPTVPEEVIVKDEVEDTVQFDDNNYSTDDSLPLEVQRRKKKKEKKQAKRVKKKAEPAEPKIDRRRRPLLNSDLSETLFTITDLTYEEQVAEIEKRQESSNYRNAVFKCTECYKGFLDEDAYSAHMMRHTDECGLHRCSICKTRFAQRHALRKHVTAHHTQRYSCTACAFVTTHRQTARLHERWHRGTRYRCPHCPDEFVKFTTYMGHIRIKHPSDFVCALCGYSFVSQKGLDMHRKLKHRGGGAGEVPADGPACERCDVRFASVDAYRRHLSVSARHADDPDAAKSKRGKRSKEPAVEARAGPGAGAEGEGREESSGGWRRAGGAIPCEQCGLQLEDSRAYHGHFRRAHPDKNRTNYPAMRTPAMCEVCGRMFQSEALLRDHRWTHTGERPFACESCGKRFRMRQRLVAHRRVHAPRRQHACALCGKTFSTASNRQRHMFIHTGLKPFKCEMCGKCFKHASEKRAHVTYVHLKKPWPKRARTKRPRASETAAASETEIMWDKLDMPPAPPPPPDKPVYYNLKI